MSRVEIYPVYSQKGPPFVVTLSRMGGHWVFSRHSERDTWETQGGRIEEGETPLDAAKRELYEECGALKFTIEPMFDYTVDGGKPGVAFYAEISELGDLPESEMAEVRLFDSLPENLTYPHITPVLFEEVCRRKGIER